MVVCVEYWLNYFYPLCCALKRTKSARKYITAMRNRGTARINVLFDEMNYNRNLEDSEFLFY